jgi:Family of unknown function (DUF5691)
MTDPVDYDDLVIAATVGVDRRPLPLDSLAGPAAVHAGVLDPGDPAAALLDAAALLTSARRAGVLAGAAGDVAAAAPDTAPELSRNASAVLGYALRGKDPGLLADLLTAAAEAGFRAAAPMLPALLDAAARDRSLRPAVSAVLGARGRWLAAHRTDWQRVTDAAGPVLPGGRVSPGDPVLPSGPGSPADPAFPGSPVVSDDPAVWATGRRSERRPWLAALRQRDPDEARELLAAGWSRETGDDREELLQILAIRLSAADEPFLEAALDDRKSSVRQVAARLLAGMPDSAFARRAISRGTAALRVERQALRRRLAVALPEPGDDTAARDGISAVSPSPVIGARAWLLTQVIAAVPLPEWTTRLGLRADALAALPVHGGFYLDLHAGWRIAAVEQRDASWAAALLAAGDQDDPGRPSSAWPTRGELAAVLPAAARMARAQAMLTRHGPNRETAAAVSDCPGPWTEDLSGAVLRQFAIAVRADKPPRWTDLLLSAAARKLPATGRRDYAADLRALAETGTADGSLHTGLRRAADIVDRRRYFLQELH